MTAAPEKMEEALKALALPNSKEGHKARADFLAKHGLRMPRLHSDVVVVVAREALKCPAFEAA